MKKRSINILMYHSISRGDGPTCIDPSTFRSQMRVLAECGFRGVSLAAALGWVRGASPAPSNTVVLTFDDGYADFAESAYPELRARGWGATVFLPAGKVGGRADWDRGPGSRLMDWATIEALAKRDVDFGAHGVTHADLTALPRELALKEIHESGRMIEQRIGRKSATFAPPFGRSNGVLRSALSESYQVAAGTRLGRAAPGVAPFDLPRIEMWYFRDARRWRAYLRGSANGYFLLRKILRRARGLLCPA